MYFFVKILLGFLIGAIIGILIDFFRRKRKIKTIKDIPEGKYIDVLKQYSMYDIGENKIRHTMRMVLGNKTPDILYKYNYSL